MSVQEDKSISEVMDRIDVGYAAIASRLSKKQLKILQEAYESSNGVHWQPGPDVQALVDAGLMKSAFCITGKGRGTARVSLER